MEGGSETRVPDLGEFRLGDWRVSQTEGTLAKDGGLIRLEPRVMDVLVYLAASPGRVVSKEHLLGAVWDGSFVEEGALSQAVHSLRKALGDDARQPRYIQTIPKRGYRLVAEVGRGVPPADITEPVLAPTDGHEPPPRGRLGRRHPARLLVVGLVGLAAVVSWIASNRFRTQPIRIVVLPFENIGKPTEEDASFTYGLTEEITNGLASLPSLQVIARPSALQYKDTKKTVQEIGGDLKVQYVLGGTVQWEKDLEGRAKVRIIPRFSRVADNTHLPCPAFEQRVDDILEAPEKISRQVIGQLNIVPRKAAEQRLGRRPTDSSDAYRAYLRGLELKNQPFYSEEHLREAVRMFERALALDPDFAGAWAELSQAHSYLAYNAEPSPARIELARKSLARALALDSDLPSVRLAEAYFTYRCLEDFPAARRQFSAAADRYPNDAEILEGLGLVLRRLGDFEEAIKIFQHAWSMNPRRVKLPLWIAEIKWAMRDFEQADHFFDLAISMAPDQAPYWSEKAENLLDWTGEAERVRRLLLESPMPESPGLMPVYFQLDLYERRYERALERLTAEALEHLPPQVESRVEVLSVLALERIGDHDGALVEAEKNRKKLADRVIRFPLDPFYQAYLALSLAQLGRRGEALELGQRAVRQAEGDAFSGPRMREIQAEIDATLGRRREALNGLRKLLATSYQCPISVIDLRSDPAWDGLRSEPEFSALAGRFGS